MINCLRYGIIIRNAKIERGNKATDWTPAPEDVDLSISDTRDSLQDSINNAQETADQAITSSEDAKNKFNDLNEIVQGSVTKITELEQSVDGWSFDFEELVKTVSDMDGQISNEIYERLKYIRFVDGNIILGNTESPINLVISNDNLGVIYYNGDDQNVNARFYNAEYWPGGNNYYAYFYPAVHGSIRVNYTYLLCQ